MRKLNLRQIEKLPRLYDYLHSDNGEFQPEKLVLNIGLYEPILIDVSDIKISVTHSVPVANYSESTESITSVEVSKDVKTLHKIIRCEENIYVPCDICGKQLAFTHEKRDTNSKARINAEDKASGIYHNNIFQCARAFYLFLSDNMMINKPNQGKLDIQNAQQSCIQGVLDNAGDFETSYKCTLNSEHKLLLYFNIHRAIDICDKTEELLAIEKKMKDKCCSLSKKENELLANYNKLNDYLIIEKVGQNHSMADLQFYNTQNYKSILENERFIDYKMALGLYASGVGCGSLLYLRRIFECIVNKEFDNNKSRLNIDENNLTMNKKIKKLEEAQIIMVPNELSQVKDKIYGYLSKGVHELSENEANELFPYLKFAIDSILDNEVTKLEKEKKIKALEKVLK